MLDQSQNPDKPLDTPIDGSPRNRRLTSTQVSDSFEQSETYKWLTESDEGQELMRRANESGTPDQYLKDYLRWRNEGETHEQALQGWRGAPRRVVRDVSQIPGELKAIRRDPYGGITEHYDQRIKSAGGNQAGAIALIGWDIVWGTVKGTVEGVYNISRGQFDLEEVVHVASVALPWARTALSTGLASQLARKTVVGAGTKFFVPKKVWQEVVKELSPQDIARLQRAGIWDGKLQTLETGAEVASLTLEAEEWVHELVGAGVMRSIAETSASVYRKLQAAETANEEVEPDPDAIIEPDEIAPEGPAVEQTPMPDETSAAPEPDPNAIIEPDEVTPEGPAVEQAPMPDETGVAPEVEAEAEAAPVVPEYSAEFQSLVDQIASDPGVLATAPNSDAETELITRLIQESPDYLELPETQLYAGALIEIMTQAVRTRIAEIRAESEIEGGEPDAEQVETTEGVEGDAEGEPETGTPDETATTTEPETATETGEPEGTPEGNSAEYETLVAQIAAMPQAQDPETLQATIDAFQAVIQTLPEYPPTGREQKNLIAKLFLDVQARVQPTTAPEGEGETDGTAKPTTTSPVEGTPYRTVYSSDRKDSFRTRYGLMELGEVVPSHQLDGSEDPRYTHPDLQPREERGGIPSLKQVATQAENIRPTFLLDPFATTSDGAPIISFKQPPLVVSGNGRVMTLQKALRDHPDQWSIYQRDLRQAVAQYGIDSAELEGMTNPVLVQFLDEDVNEVIFADDANRQAGLGYSATETASRDARYLTDDIMAQWQMTGESFEKALELPENEDFRKALLGPNGIPENDHPRFMKKDGTGFSSDGINRLRNMMMRYVFRGDYGAELSRLLIESEFDSIKNIQNMLNVAIPHLALIESYVRSGIREPNLSVAEDVARAVGVLNELAQNGESVYNFVHQDMLFAPKTTLENLSLTGIEVLALMDEKQRAYQQLASVFMRYTQAVLDEPLPGESLVQTGFSPEVFFEDEVRDHFRNNTPTEILKWRQSEEEGDPDKGIPPREVPDIEFHERVEGYIANYLDAIKAQAAARAMPAPEPGFEGDAVEEPEGTPRPEGVERTGVVVPEVTPEGMTEETTPPEVEVPSVEGVEPEVTPDGIDLLPPEPKQPPPILPKNPTLKLVDITPKGTDNNVESLRTYVIAERPDVEIQISNTGDGYYVTPLIPGYHGGSIYAAKQGAVFNDAEATRAIREALQSEDFRNLDWQLNPNDPMTNQGIPDPSEAEQVRIDKMPHLKQSKKFKDVFSNTNRGITFEMPGLDPAMRLKTTFERFGRYTVYIESDAFQDALRNYELGDGAHTFIEGEGNQPTALVLRGVEGFDPMDAVKRGLARVLDDSVWDGNTTQPEPEVPSIEGSGVPGNQPPPFPQQIELRKPVLVGLETVTFSIGDGTGKIIDGYKVEVNRDPFGLDDGTMEVTMTFPGFDIEPLSEFVTAKYPEDAAMLAIGSWRGFELGKGGIGSPAGAEPTQTTIEEGESLLEDVPPLITSSERPFGDLELDTDAMDFERLKHKGVLQIYKFTSAHAPRVRTRKLGDSKSPEWHIELSYPRRNSASHISYKKDVKAAIREAVEVIESSDHAWKPVYKSGIFAEMDKVLNAANQRQFATTPAVERRLRGLFANLKRGVNVDLRGYKLSSLKELAVLGQVFRNPKFEAFTVVYLNENHEIVGHDRIAFGVPAMTGTVPNSRIQYQMKRLGARYFMDMHNHPGGVTTFSEEDKGSSRITADQFEDKYLGSVVINHGEYSETRNIENVDKHGKRNFRLQHRERIRLDSETLGWETGSDPTPTKGRMKEAGRKSWSPLHSVVRPSDPIYQYDIDTPNGKLVQMAREIGKSRDSTYAVKQEPFEMRKNIARLGKYLQLEKNWTTLFFTNYAHEIMAVMDYKDLHRLTPTQLWNFLNTEARKHGGVYTSAYIGEGDWYKTTDDVRQSSWGALMDDSQEAFRGIEHYWFEGLTDAAEIAHKALMQTGGRQMFNEHEDLSIIERGTTGYKVPGFEAGVIESQSDSDFGIDTRLTEPSPELDGLVARIYAQLDAIGTFSLDLEEEYEAAFGSLPQEMQQRFTLIQSFGRFVTNQYSLTKQQNIAEYGPSESGDMYNEIFNLETDLNINFLTQGQRATAYALSRLANITDKDTVLTLNDKDGMLATFAQMSGAGKIMTTAPDGFVRKMFENFMPGISELHNIEEANLAREWKGNRPTVVMLDGFEGTAVKIDEAMKVLAPGGRLVVSVLQHSDYFSENYWRAIQRKYKVNSFVAKEQSGMLGKDTTYLVIDKSPNPNTKFQEVGKNFVPTNPIVGLVDTEKMFAEIQRNRVTRIPVLAENAAIKYEAASNADQAIFTPLDNPYRPKEWRGSGEIEQAIAFTEELGQDKAPFLQRLIGLGDVKNPGVQSYTDSMGAPVRVTTDRPPAGDTPPPDDTPTDVSRRVAQWVREKFQDTNLKWYALSPQTAKVTLQKLGSTGEALGEKLKRIRNVGDRMFGRGTSQLDRLFPQAREFVQKLAEQNNMPLNEAIEEFDQVLVRHHEGRSEAGVPQVIDEITEEMKAFVEEHISNPMLEMNVDIMRQGLLFEMPESLVEEGALTDEARAELEADPPNFEKFMRRRNGRDQYGLVQGFVREASTGKVFAVRVKGDVYADPKTEQAQIAQSSVKYTLESPFGERIEGDATMLYDAHSDYTLIASRNPATRRWTGNRTEAKEAWDAEIENNPRPDVIAQHFVNNGITLPEGTRFVYRKVANLGEWSVRHEGTELYRIRQILPVSVNKQKKQVTESHAAYDPFKGRLLVYDANEVRAPIFIFRGATAHKLWSPMDNYFPHMIDFNSMNPDPSGGRKYQRFLQYLQQFADANEMEFDVARAILTQYIAESKTRKYGHLEQERQYNFPAFNRNYFQVWEQYIARAGHRMQTIREFGQQNDLLTAQLNEFISEDTLTEPLTDTERATLRLRFLSGYSDFTPLKKAWKQPFRDDNGSPTEINPNEGEYVAMGPGDWQALVDAGVLTVLGNGNFQATDAGIAMLENPAFLHGAMLTGMRKMSIASDIIKNQLGWRQGDLFDEEMADMIRGVQGWTGVLFLGRAWAANIAQSVNTGVALDGKSLLQGFRKLMESEKHREWTQEIGALAIDVMHDYGSGSALGTRVLRQQLGAIPRYQMGRVGWRSFVPSEENIDDFGVKMHAWTPFYAVERMNRSIAALAGRAYAVGNMKQMIRDPKKAKTAREGLLSLPGAYELGGKLDAAMRVQGLTQKDIEVVSEMLPDEVKENVPHLYPVHEFIAEFAKETADWTQHRVEAMDRGRPWTRNPIFIMMQQLQSFNIAQTKFVKDTFKREWKIMHTALNEKDLPTLLQSKGAARALGSLWLIPRILMWGGLFGIPTAILGKIIRFDTPDEDTIGLTTGLYKAGMYTQLGEYALQINRWNRGAEEIILGPTLGTLADIGGDVGQGKPLRTVSRLARPPLGGPSMKQIVEWTAPPEPRARRSSGRNRNTRGSQRRRQSGRARERN